MSTRVNNYMKRKRWLLVSVAGVVNHQAVLLLISSIAIVSILLPSMITNVYASGAAGVHARDEVRDDASLQADAGYSSDNNGGGISIIADGLYYSPGGVWDPGNSGEDNLDYGPGFGASSLSASNPTQDAPDDPKWWDEQAESFLRKQFYGHGTRRARATRADGSPGPQYDIKKKYAYKDSSTGFYHYTTIEEFDGLPIANSQSWVHLDTKGNPYYGQNGFFYSSEGSNQTYQLHETALRALEDDPQKTADRGEISASDAIYAYAKIKGFNAHLPQNMVEYPSEDKTEKNGRVSVLGSGISYGGINAEKVYYNDQKKGLVKVWQIDVISPLAAERVMMDVIDGEIIAASSFSSPAFNPLDVSLEDYTDIGDKEKIDKLISIASPELLLRNNKSGKDDMQHIYDSEVKNIGLIKKMVDEYNEQTGILDSIGTGASMSASGPTNVPLPKLEDLLSYGGLGTHTPELTSQTGSNANTTRSRYRRSAQNWKSLVRTGKAKIKRSLGLDGNYPEVSDITIQSDGAPGPSGGYIGVNDVTYTQNGGASEPSGGYPGVTSIVYTQNGGAPGPGGSNPGATDITYTQDSGTPGPNGGYPGAAGIIYTQNNGTPGPDGRYPGATGIIFTQDGGTQGQGGNKRKQTADYNLPKTGGTPRLGGDERKQTTDNILKTGGTPEPGSDNPKPKKPTDTTPKIGGSVEPGNAISAEEDSNVSTGGVPRDAGLSIGISTSPVDKYSTINGGVDGLFLTKIQGNRNFSYVYVPQNTPASPNGWFYSDKGEGGGYATVGNNVLAQSAPGVRVNSGGGRSIPNGAKAYSPGNNKGNPRGDLFMQPLNSNENKDAAAMFVGNPISGSNVDSEESLASGISNAFFIANQYHDIMSLYGFDEAAGNFQDKPVTNGGRSGDPVVILTRGTDKRNNAYFLVPPDGGSGLLTSYMYSSSNASGTADPSFDLDIMVHELSHGLINRLTGGPADANFCGTGTKSLMVSSYSEGASDGVGMLWGISPGDDRNTVRRYGNDELQANFPMRRRPYTTDAKINDLSYGNYCSAGGPNCESHANGQIWATALYEATWNLIDAEGFEPSLANVNSDKGNVHMLKYLIEGAKIQPCSPSFITSRDSIIKAEGMITGGKNKCHLWKAFAKRGLGMNAKEPEVTGGVGVDNFDVPPECRDSSK